MAAAISHMDDDAAFLAFEHDVGQRMEAIGAADVGGLIQSDFCLQPTGGQPL